METQGLALGGEEIGLGPLICACMFKVCIFGGGSSLREGPLILGMPDLELHIELHQLENEATL